MTSDLALIHCALLSPLALKVPSDFWTLGGVLNVKES